MVGSLCLLLALLIGLRRATETRGTIPPLSVGDRDTVVDGVRWRSRESGGLRGAGDPVIFVHGFLSSSVTWRQVLADAAAGRQAIAVDLPGSGFSDRPWPYDYTALGQAERLLRYLDVRGLRRVCLVCSSFGGAVCEAVAAARPDRVAALVLADAAFPGIAIPIGFRVLRTPVVGDLQIELLTRPVMAYTLRHRLYARPERVTQTTVNDWWYPIPVPGTRRAALAAVRMNTRGTERMLEKIRAPTLVLWGKEDALLEPSQGLALSSAIEGARFVVMPDVGHLPQEEDPAGFSRTVAEFLKQLPETPQ
ncbi:MAG: alpha/beta fold hydrolase [Acidobacteria bacterium]|nr:alpha/beta fold hydrolase [Acidobacteriota bacterium]